MCVRWLECGGGNSHIIAPCPDCYASQGGLLVGMFSTMHRGPVTTRCTDCGKRVDYYVDSYDKKIWKLEPVEMVRNVMKEEVSED